MIAMRRLQSQNVRIGMRFLLAGQGEIDGILQGPPHRTYVEIGGLVAIVVLVEGKASARHIDGVQGDSVIREVFLDKIAELDIYRGVCQDTFQRYFRWLHGFDSKRGIFCQTSLPPTAIGTLCLTLRATLCRKEIAGSRTASDRRAGDITIFTRREDHRLATGKAHVEILHIKAGQSTGNNFNFRSIDYR